MAEVTDKTLASPFGRKLIWLPVVWILGLYRFNEIAIFWQVRDLTLL